MRAGPAPGCEGRGKLRALLMPRRNLLVAAVVLTLVAVILVLSSPFGGMSVRVPYGDAYVLRDRFASLGSEYSELVDNAVILVLAMCLIVGGFLNGIALAADQKAVPGLTRGARMFSAAAFGVAILGGVVYHAIRAAADYPDWWLDTGFYAGLTAGGVSSVLYTVMLRRPAGRAG